MKTKIYKVRTGHHKKCLICSKTFYVMPCKVSQKYCSRECARQSQILAGNGKYSNYKRLESICQYCGEKFLTKDTTRKFCSRKCGSLNKQKRINIKCTHCGKQFEITPSMHKRGHKFCSSECRNASRQTIYINRTCKYCGETFKVSQSEIQRRPCLFCSLYCSGKSFLGITGENHPRYNQIVKSCDWCGKQIKIHPYKLRDCKHHFCSRRCVGAYSTSIQGGHQSSIEKKLLSALDKHNIQCEPQYRIGQFSIDIAIPHLKIAIECDGDYWHSLPKQKKKDYQKDKFLIDNDWNILRFTETEINNHLIKCTNQIIKHLSNIEPPKQLLLNLFGDLRS